jgi:predicted kinase
MYKLLKEKRSFVIDDTNSNERFRSKLVSFLRRNGANIICVLLKTPLDVCKDRRNGQIPQEVMDKLHRKFAEPKDNEYDEIIVV